MDKEVKKQIEDTIKNDKGFIKDNNYKLISLDEDSCVFEASISNSSLNPYDIAHGGFIFGLADTCGGCLASTIGKASVTTNANVVYLHKGSGNKLIAVAKFLKKGKSLSNIEVEIKNDKDEIVSKVILEYFCL